MSARSSSKRKRSESASAPRPGAKKLLAACTACRKQKIKCDMPTEEPPCSRCERRGLSCVLHTSALRSQNIDHRQVALLGQDIVNIFATLQRICDKLGIERPPQLLSTTSTTTLTDDPDRHQDPDHSHDARPIEEDQNRTAEEACEDGTGTGVYELSPPASPSTVQAPIDPYLSGSNHPPPPGVSGDHTSLLLQARHGGPESSSKIPHEYPHRQNSSQRGRKPSNGGASSSSGTGAGAQNRVADLITKGILTHDRAEALVQRYLLHLDRFLYGIASHYQSAAQVRRASPTLLAAMCAVAAFQQVSRDRTTFDLCYREYRSLVSNSLFEKRGVEYIRALCIGSFWLLDSSRILLSDAVRRAADVRLHRYWHRLAEEQPKGLAGTNRPPEPSTAASGSSVVVGDRKEEGEAARDRIRLWFLLFIADRHLSILHNRDALTRQEKDAIEDRDRFLAAAGDDFSLACNNDVRLISQVSLLVIMGQIRDVFGSERPRPLPKAYMVQFTHFSIELDRWYQKYSPYFEPDEHIGGFPLAGLTMHYQYARLYLGHYIFQGLNNNNNNNNKDTPVLIPVHFLPAARAARQAALTIFSIIVDNSAFRDNITGMPHYFHVMITFAGHCLLDMVTKYHEQLGIGEKHSYDNNTESTAAAEAEAGGVQDDLNRVAAALALFARSPAAAAPQHPVARALVGLTRKLNECTARLGVESVLTGSPFQTVEYANLMTDFGKGTVSGASDEAGGVRAGAAAVTGGAGAGAGDGFGTRVVDGIDGIEPLDMQAFGGLPDEFWYYGDFGDFNFVMPDSHTPL